MHRGNELRGSLTPGDVAASNDVTVVLGAAVDRDRVRGLGQVGERRLDHRLTSARCIEILQQEGRQHRGVITGSLVNDDDLTTGAATSDHGDRRLTAIATENGERVDV